MTATERTIVVKLVLDTTEFDAAKEQVKAALENLSAGVHSEVVINDGTALKAAITRVRDKAAERNAVAYDTLLEMRNDVQNEFNRAIDNIAALRAQLDNMTVEWGNGTTDGAVFAPRVSRVVAEWFAEDWNKGVPQGKPRSVVYQRLVSPWTVVEGDTTRQEGE